MTEMTEQENTNYLNGLQAGEDVIETGDNCMWGMTGKVYVSEEGHTCVMWDNKMGTSVTWGTRRITDKIYEMPVYCGRLKHWRILNLLSGTIYSSDFATKELAEAAIEHGQTRGGKIVRQTNKNEVYKALVSKHLRDENR